MPKPQRRASQWNGTQQDTLTGNSELMHLINLTVRGGWPASIDVPVDVAFELPKSYIDAGNVLVFMVVSVIIIPHKPMSSSGKFRNI